MFLHEIAFYSIIFFLIGVFIAGFALSSEIVLLFNFLFAAIIFAVGRDKFVRLAALSFFIIIGFFYYQWRDAEQNRDFNIPIGEKIVVEGIIDEYPQNGNNQKLIIKIQKPFFGKILANLKLYPSFDYGDLVKIEGVVKKPEPRQYADYLAKDGVLGIINYPKIDLIGKNKASPLKAKLFELKTEIIAVFQKTLAPEKAAFLSGITLGERAEFSKELKEKMSLSGTTHLVALSGQNITIIAAVVGSFFGYFLRRKLVFWPTLMIIVFFVLMAGAEASVVRAAVMGGIIMFAERVGRIHSMRNAIAVAAFLMVLFNPKILRFDMGFQLSFLALLGIVYLAPAIQKFFRFKEEKGFLGWRENFLTTTSAQLAVLPLILANFSVFSIFSLPANILILETIPMTMIFGFILGALGFISIHLAAIFGWFVSLFLAYELAVINIFSKFPQTNFEMKISGAIVYYLTIIGFIVFMKNKK